MFRWIALIAAIVLVCALAGMIVYSQSPSDPPQEQASPTNKAENPAQKNDKTLWDSWFPDSISVYTLFLVVFTGVLAFAGIIQLNALDRAEKIALASSKAAKDSADAAKQSADAVASIERPYFFILAKVPQIPKDGPFKDVATPKVAYQIVNLGRVPGILRILYVRCFLQPAGPLPEKPAVDPKRFRQAQNPIAAGLTSTDYPPCDFDVPFTEQDWHDIAAGSKVPIFMAIAVYEGAFDYTYAYTATYAANLFEGHSYAIGDANYNTDNSERGRITKGATASIPNIIWDKTDAR
jgi:hypothetical protein